MRIACVQNGNYTEAAKRLAGGGAEDYGGQRYTVDAFQRWVGDRPHAVISLDATPHRLVDGKREYVGIRSDKPYFLMPRRVSEHWRAWRAIAALGRFRPTHLLLRCNDVVGCDVLRWAIQRKIPTGVIIASRFRTEHPPCMRFCALANHPLVSFVANHNRVARDSLLECGLRPSKAVMWDYPALLEPSQYDAKTLEPGQTIRLVYAGMVRADKGVHDLVDAAHILRRHKLPVEVRMMGVGEALTALQRHPGVAEGWLHLLGQRENSQVIEEMRAATLAVVPSRHDFPEALPLVIHEALSVRTPVILSDHPVFLEYFQDGNAVRFFQSKSPESLAKIVEQLSSDRCEYERLSQQTRQVSESFQIENKFHHLLERLALEWGMEKAVTTV
jgi:glycosyltransferase involved in cell wall biosynthesis